jgi:hypothetical protein
VYLPVAQLLILMALVTGPEILVEGVVHQGLVQILGWLQMDAKAFYF